MLSLDCSKYCDQALLFQVTLYCEKDFSLQCVVLADHILQAVLRLHFDDGG